MLMGLAAQPTAEDCSGKVGHSPAELLSSAASSRGLPAGGTGVSEVEILNGDESDVVSSGVAGEAGDGVPDLRVAASAAAGEFKLDPLGLADWVAVGVEATDGKVPVV
jgi:hypothetical protein